MGAVSLMDEEQVETFLRPLREIKPRMVVIDTLADSMMGADENSTRDVGEYMSKCNRIKRALDCTLLLIHHTNKGGIQERGNIRIRGSADAVLRLIPEDDIVRLESSKLKDARAFPPRELSLLTVPVWIEGKEIESAVFIEAEKIVPDADRLTTNQQRVLEAFGMEVFADGIEVGDIVDTTDIARGSVQRVLSRLLRLELIAQDGKKSPYRLTGKGQDALTRMTRLTRLTHSTPSEESNCSPVSHASHASHASHENLTMFKEINGASSNYYQRGG
jgi:predicted transcriptional regulator